MEIQLPSLVQSFWILLSIFIFLKLAGYKLMSRNSSINLPPGPRKFPFIGNMHNLVGSVPHRALRDLSLKYGPIMHLQVGELSIVVISSPDVAKEVMKTHDINFASRPSLFVADIASYGCTSITFGPYGDYWRQLRKICTTELLSVKRVQSFRPIREEVNQDLIKWIADHEGSTINLTEKVSSSTNDVVSRTSMGKKTKEKEILISTLAQLMELASGFNIVDLYPSIKYLQVLSGLGPKVHRLHKTVDRILEGIIHEHKVSYGVKEGEKREDLIDVLLKFQDDGYELPLTNDNIKAVLLDILGAGTETSSTTVDWAMVELLKHPTVLKKVQDEVRHACDPKGYVDESCLDELKYLKAIIKETLRLHSPVPLVLPRKSSKECEINGYFIPADTKVIVNGWAINRDSKSWNHAECFIPERFLESSVDYRGNNFEYIPFGSGRRMCPGISFGLANVELPLAKFLYHFDWKLSNGMKHEEMDMTEEFGITARRKKDLFVIPLMKRNLHA